MAPPSPPSCTPPPGVGPCASAYEALTRQIARLGESGWRLARYAPPPSLPLAEARILPAGPRVRAEILDLSARGVRVAIDAGVAIAQGAPCEVTVNLQNGEAHGLRGRVLWVQNHQMIIVFAVTPDDAGA
ncbi:MAG: PilZ domain-containing protein [Synechococcaceae cyanobacterium]|jgi:hypothetical protein